MSRGKIHARVIVRPEKEIGAFVGSKGERADLQRVGVQRVLHPFDHETEAGEVETRAQLIWPWLASLPTTSPIDRCPEKKINNITELAREPGDRLEEHRHRGDKNDRRRREEEILLDENERLKRPFATHRSIAIELRRKPPRKVMRKARLPRNLPSRYSSDRIGVEAAMSPQRVVMSRRMVFEIT